MTNKKKTLTLFAMLIVILLSGIISACGGSNEYTLSVVFKGVDPRLGLVDYTQTNKNGADVNIEFTIPAGYEHESLTVNLGRFEIDYDVEFGDEFDEGYSYTVDKKISMTIMGLNSNSELVLDMTNVTKRKFDIVINSDLIDATCIKSGYSAPINKLSALLLNQDLQGALTVLDETTVIGSVDMVDNKISIEYGEEVVLLYDKPSGRAELDCLYSSVGHFVDESDEILYNGGTPYMEVPLARRGATFYSLTKSGIVQPYTRAYYIGVMQEDITLSKNIPHYVEDKGVAVENNENKFAIFTNKQDYSSTMLTINMYRTTNNTYNPANENMQQIEVGGNTVTLEKVFKYNDDGSLKNPTLLYETFNRYDVYSMYLGTDINNDSLMDSSEKASLPTEYYLGISSSLGVDAFNVKLLSYEKQSVASEDKPLVDFGDNEKISSANNSVLYKLNQETLEQFIIERTETISGQSVTYRTGSAFLYIQLKHTEMSHDGSNISAIKYLTTYDQINNILDYDYEVVLYIENADGSKDYGYVDLHDYEDADRMYFETEKMWTRELIEEGTGSYYEYTYHDVLRIDIKGPEYNDYYTPMIKRIYWSMNDRVFVSAGMVVEDPKTCNGVIGESLSFEGYHSQPEAGGQYRLNLSFDLNSYNEGYTSIDYSGLQFDNTYSDAFFVTGRIDFDEYTDFTRIDYLSCTQNITLGISNDDDIYYFTTGELSLDWGIYVGVYNELTQTYEGVKDESRKITSYTRLKDIKGNYIEVYINNTKVNVYVLYQNCDVFGDIGDCYFAYN